MFDLLSGHHMTSQSDVQYLVAALSESPSDSFRFDTLFDYGVFSIQLPARV